ncbi:CPBP family intramembrane glutamic endopeptidase [Microbulbifer sp. CnH-101-E]|uniref:CPBP family intramembrane glutamic endopeptidase n=1 Tax=unclassified Microbulbifer TaxID=2619833 RepID=UPI00403987B2
MKQSLSSLKIIAVFLTLTACLYPIGYWLIFHMESAVPLMLSVGLATIITCLSFKKSLGSLGWPWGSWKHQWFSYLAPLAYVAVAYLIIWGLGFGEWYNSEYVTALRDGYKVDNWSDSSVIIFRFLITASISFILLLPGVLGEEIGWRGLLVPELSKLMSFSGVALISGFIWAAWHWLMMIAGVYGNETVPLGYQLFFFTLGLMSMSVIMTYIRLRSNSVWPAVIFHMSHNVFIQKFFNPLTMQNTDSGWYINEFGVVLPVVIFCTSIYFWRKGQQEFGSIQPKSTLLSPQSS